MLSISPRSSATARQRPTSRCFIIPLLTCFVIQQRIRLHDGIKDKDKGDARTVE